MALRSPSAKVVKSSDPYELERLAEELATREAARSSAPSHKSEDDVILPRHDLPLHVPLSHDYPFLTAETFNVEEFLLSRSYTSLPDLKAELRDYLSSLKEELVQLINDDYEAFISLSTDLRGEGARLEKLKYPLGDLKLKIIDSRKGLQDIQDAIQDKLEKRAIIREEKALLHLLLKISESVTTLESLLLISQPDQDVITSPELQKLKIPAHVSDTQAVVDNRSHGSRAKHLARVAAEYTQLLYHVLKARSDKCAFVDEIRWRIDRLQSTISSDLDHLFASTLVALTNSKDGKVNEIEKVRLTADMTECLRIYDVLHLWRDAEEVLSKEIVRKFVQKTIYSGALGAPHSPIMPHTPLPTLSHHPTSGPFTTSLAPHTPYTPFTAFATKQNPFDFSYGSHLSSVHLLDESEDPLARLYNQVLRFVERDLRHIMEIAEKVSLRSAVRLKDRHTISSSPPQPTDSEQAYGSTEVVDGFDIMANVLWAEIGKSILDELGPVVFAAGNPAEFRKHYETTQAFIRSLEFLAPSTQSVESMRSHPVSTAFERRWQLPVYFQLRWKEIVGKLEESLAATVIEPSSSNSTKDKNPFMTIQALSVYTAIVSCWSADVYIPDLSHRFWRLTLQILSRYRTWLQNSSLSLDAPMRVAPGAQAEKGSTPSSRTSTPAPGGVDHVSTENIAADDNLLRQFAATIADVQMMISEVQTLWRNEIGIMLPEASANGDMHEVSPEDALQRQLNAFSDLVETLSSQILTILIRRSCEALIPVRSIPSQFRAMSNKRSPTEPSYFVSSILRPLKNFFGIGVNDGPGERLSATFLHRFSTEVFDNVCQRYIQYLSAMRKTEESLRRLKKGKKSTFSLFSSHVARDEDDRDEERIRDQMILDVEKFAKDAESLGIDVRSIDSFKSLNDMVHEGLGSENP